MKRSIALAGGAAALWFGAATAAAAPQPEPTLVLEPNPVAAGARFTATLEDFCTSDDGPDVVVTFYVEGGFTIASCGGNDLAIATLTAPSTPGQYDVRAEFADSFVVSSLVVQEGAPSAEEPLPDTGSATTVALTAVGGGLLGVGIVLLMTARSRRPSAV